MSDRKVLLVTGGSSDVGKCLINHVVEEYEHIWVLYHSSDDIAKELFAMYGDKIKLIKCDFLDENDVSEMINRIRKSGIIPSHIVHLASLKAKNLQFHKVKWTDYQKAMDASLRSITLILQAFLPDMSKKRYGKIVFMLTSYIIGVPPKFQSTYVTTKYALLGLMKSLASEYSGRGITVNAVSPEMMETKFLSNLPELVIEQSRKESPMGRNIEVNEVVPTIDYLLSDDSNMISGQNIAITAGNRF